MSFGGKPYPFETSQLVAWEIFAIGLPSFFLALEPNNERLQGSLMGNILAKSLPSGIAEASCVFGSFLLCHFAPTLVAENPNDTFPRFVALSVVTFSFFAYVTLFRICMPMRKYRGTVFAGSLAFGIGVFLLDFFVRDKNGRGILLQIPWTGLAKTFIPAALMVIAFAIVVYVLTTLLIQYIRRRYAHENPR